MRHPGFQRLPQMRFRERNEPVQTFAAKGTQDTFTNGIRFWTSRRALQYTQTQPLDGRINLGRENAVAIVQQVLLSSPSRLRSPGPRQIRTWRFPPSGSSAVVACDSRTIGHCQIDTTMRSLGKG